MGPKLYAKETLAECQKSLVGIGYLHKIDTQKSVALLISALYGYQSLCVHKLEDGLLTFDLNTQMLWLPKEIAVKMQLEMLDLLSKIFYYY